MSSTIHDVLRHLVEHAHFGSDENRQEALDAVDAEYGPKDEKPARPAASPKFSDKKDK